MNKNKPLQISTLCLSAVLFSCLIAHGQTIENLVFTEQSSTVVTESLNGVPIGNWVVNDSEYAPEILLNDTTTIGTLLNITPGTYGIDFLDPVYNGNFFFYNKNSGLIGTDVPGSVITGGFYPGTGATDYLPYSATGAEVETSQGPIPVNITVQGTPQTTVPDTCSSNMLLMITAAALALAKKFAAERELHRAVINPLV